MGFLWGVTFVLFTGTWLYALNAGGRILLDCGSHPTKFLFLMNAALFAAIGLGGTFVGSSFSRSIAIASPVLGISFGIYWLIMASGGSKIREGGLCSTGDCCVGTRSSPVGGVGTRL